MHAGPQWSYYGCGLYPKDNGVSQVPVTGLHLHIRTFILGEA